MNTGSLPYTYFGLGMVVVRSLVPVSEFESRFRPSCIFVGDTEMKFFCFSSCTLGTYISVNSNPILIFLKTYFNMELIFM